MTTSAIRVYTAVVALICTAAITFALSGFPTEWLHVRGVAYKGTVEITTRPPERRALRS